LTIGTSATGPDRSSTVGLHADGEIEASDVEWVVATSECAAGALGPTSGFQWSRPASRSLELNPHRVLPPAIEAMEHCVAGCFCAGTQTAAGGASGTPMRKGQPRHIGSGPRFGRGSGCGAGCPDPG